MIYRGMGTEAEVNLIYLANLCTFHHCVSFRVLM
jgi:hypothetical protein